jgi:hypothetical protein
MALIAEAESRDDLQGLEGGEEAEAAASTQEQGSFLRKRPGGV